jgi:hypothetical protein
VKKLLTIFILTILALPAWAQPERKGKASRVMMTSPISAQDAITPADVVMMRQAYRRARGQLERLEKECKAKKIATIVLETKEEKAARLQQEANQRTADTALKSGGGLLAFILSMLGLGKGVKGLRRRED